jgi:DNA ligase (NAD+)
MNYYFCEKTYFAMSAQARIDELTELLNHYNDRYYQDAVSEISDQEFDLVLEL